MNMQYLHGLPNGCTLLGAYMGFVKLKRYYNMK